MVYAPIRSLVLISNQSPATLWIIVFVDEDHLPGLGSFQLVGPTCATATWRVGGGDRRDDAAPARTDLGGGSNRPGRWASAFQLTNFIRDVGEDPTGAGCTCRPTNCVRQPTPGCVGWTPQWRAFLAAQLVRNRELPPPPGRASTRCRRARRAAWPRRTGCTPAHSRPDRGARLTTTCSAPAGASRHQGADRRPPDGLGAIASLRAASIATFGRSTPPRGVRQDAAMLQPSSVDVRPDKFFRLFDNHKYRVIYPLAGLT